MIATSNLASLLRQTSARLPGHTALIHGDLSRTWRTVQRRVDNAAAGLQARGVVKGDRVLVQARNGPALFESFWACWTIGAVVVPTNVRLTPPEIAYLAQSSGATVHLMDRAFAAHQAACPPAQIVIDMDAGWESLAETADAAPALADMDRDDAAWFFYTSGTTGRPKAGILTHGQLAFVVTNHLCDLMPGTTERDVSLVVAPLSHGAGIHALSQVARGAVSVLTTSDRLDPAEAWSLIERHRVTNLFTVPTILNALARHADAQPHALRYVIYAGAPMYLADLLHAMDRLGPVLVQYFGLGEVTGNITVLPPHEHATAPPGTCGFARTGMEIAILDAAGRRQMPGETGEICVRGPAVFAGYHDDPAATAAAFAQGWFHTGDLGHLDQHGWLFITGRASDMYISGGSNVYPREVEEALLLHPAVAEACVVGVPDPKWGESGVAVLVLHPGAVAEPAELLAALDGRLARYKHPAHAVVWPELPRSGYGKVVKRDVRARLGMG